jgi:hypothetical protein
MTNSKFYQVKARQLCSTAASKLNPAPSAVVRVIARRTLLELEVGQVSENSSASIHPPLFRSGGTPRSAPCARSRFKVDCSWKSYKASSSRTPGRRQLSDLKGGLRLEEMNLPGGGGGQALFCAVQLIL